MYSIVSSYYLYSHSCNRLGNNTRLNYLINEYLLIVYYYLKIHNMYVNCVIKLKNNCIISFS